MKKFKETKTLVYACLFGISLLLIGCNATTTTTTETPNTDTTVSDANKDNETADKTDANKDSDNPGESIVEAKEPDKYEAKVSINLEAIGGENNAAMPKLEAKVARDGNNKRMEFNAPNGQKYVYLEIGDKNLLILPDKKQYAEINKNAVGFEVRSLMTPKQIVDRAKNIKGLEKVGEEKYNGRDATKYKYSATTDTKTKAGEVATDSFVIVDKETGLPLKTEIVSTSNDSSVQGFKGIKVVTEMSDIKTEVSDEMFKEPEDFEKIDEKQIRSQINLIFNVAGQFLKQMMQNANGK